jgi:hypothetical protein
VDQCGVFVSRECENKGAATPDAIASAYYKENSPPPTLAPKWRSELMSRVYIALACAFTLNLSALADGARSTAEAQRSVGQSGPAAAPSASSRSAPSARGQSAPRQAAPQRSSPRQIAPRSSTSRRVAPRSITPSVKRIRPPRLATRRHRPWRPGLRYSWVIVPSIIIAEELDWCHYHRWRVKGMHFHTRVRCHRHAQWNHPAIRYVSGY